jgi:hypothetical protein
VYKFLSGTSVPSSIPTKNKPPSIDFHWLKENRDWSVELSDAEVREASNLWRILFNDVTCSLQSVHLRD